jgi:hypothetical protein
MGRSRTAQLGRTPNARHRKAIEGHVVCGFYRVADAARPIELQFPVLTGLFSSPSQLLGGEEKSASETGFTPSCSVTSIPGSLPTAGPRRANLALHSPGKRQVVARRAACTEGFRRRAAKH